MKEPAREGSAPPDAGGQADDIKGGLPYPFDPLPRQALDLLRRGTIEATDICVLIVIVRFRNGDSSWVTKETIRRMMGFSIPTIKRSLSRLTSAGLIERVACGKPDPKNLTNMTGYRFDFTFGGGSPVIPPGAHQRSPRGLT